MRHLELHILQSFPVSALNRDDLGSPKSAFFGGVKRARVSSQSWKRAVREMAREMAPEFYTGVRTKFLTDLLKVALDNEGVKDSRKVAGAILERLLAVSEKTARRIADRVIFYTSPSEIAKIASLYKDCEKAEEKDPIGKLIKTLGKKVYWDDAADIAFFGRSVACDPSLDVEGAAMFNHAISTHAVSTEYDFFSAVDDFKKDVTTVEAVGLSAQEFQSATFYRFVALNLDMLSDKQHLGALSVKQRRAIVAAFIEATLKAVPASRLRSMNANTLPFFVLGIVREKGHPVQFVNAFESALTPVVGEGYAGVSEEALRNEAQYLKERWSLNSALEVELSKRSKTTMNELIEQCIAYVE